MPTPRMTFEKVFNGSDKTKHVKQNVVKKLHKIILKKPIFGVLPKIRDWIQKYVQTHVSILLASLT